MLFGAFQPLKPAPGGPATIFPWGRRVTKTFAQRSLGKTTQRLATRKKHNLIGTMNPDFKDLAQPWEWKMITAHEKMYP
jgi:hypothetical protein